jgi:hypothetical protein
MKFMVTWTITPGTVREAVDRFLAGEAQKAEGLKRLGRWHRADCSGGFVLYEGEDAAALFADAARWCDVLTLHVVPVIEDEEAGAAFAKVFKK